MRLAVTKMISEIESSLEPKVLVVPVFRATGPSSISERPAVMYRM